MSIPEVDHRGTVIRLTWKDERLIAVVSRLIREKEGTLKGQLIFSTTNQEYNSHLIGQSYNFGSPLARKNLKRDLSEKYKENVDWDSVVEQLSALTEREIDKGEPAREVWTTDDTKRPEYKLKPVMFENETNLIFGPGGKGKSLLGAYFVVSISIGWLNNPLGLMPKSGKVLICDWEASQDAVTDNVKRIKRGHHLPEFAWHYQKCDDSLVNMADRIYEVVMDNAIDTIVIDSVSGATGGDKNESQVATTFFNVLRRFNCTIELIDHVSKDQFDKRKGANGPTGSVTYWNRPRSIWELAQTQEPSDNQIHVALFHRKSNLSRLSLPIGMVITFDDTVAHEETTTFKLVDVGSMPAISPRLSLKKRIQYALRHGLKTVQELAEELEETQVAVRARLNEMSDETPPRVMRVKEIGKWGLMATGDMEF